MIDLLCDPETHIFVDPAFGDHGRMYKLMDESMPRQMRKLISRAKTIVPNLTEACLLLDAPYPGDQCDESLIQEFCLRLSSMGPENVVITDVNFHPTQAGVAVYSRGMDKPVYCSRPRIDRVFHGTGDVFASFLLGSLMNGQTLRQAVDTALDATHASILETIQSGEPLRYGVQFEKILPAYWQTLKRT